MGLMMILTPVKNGNNMNRPKEKDLKMLIGIFVFLFVIIVLVQGAFISPWFYGLSLAIISAFLLFAYKKKEWKKVEWLSYALVLNLTMIVIGVGLTLLSYIL
ncbi:hypothetical protein STSP2_01420 [Anaerohalosphaera lusitana]|uniref:Uncharacterized protein n=1 Tax=Anaerohalosphaera lusitana TaxID=1936003 RepID=A0A1U9NKK4_9BACT|nr:hypothetical protein [Anaerohalosphaera lusitana]AQT68264.1 hypothetical protein STSP2_01420 [Anaerohalosphaera lusitana]